MIKVVHVITDMKIGGAGKWLLNLLHNYDRDRLDIVVAVPEDSMLKEEISRLGVKAVEIKGIGDKSLDLGSINSFYKLFKRLQPDIVHTHASVSARVAAKLAGVEAIIHTKHCIDSPKTGIKRAASKSLNQMLSSKIIAVSEAVRQNLLEAGIPDSMIKVIYGGVDEAARLSVEDINEIKKSYGIEEQDLVYGIVARLAAVKGHKYLIEAADIVVKRNGNIKFVVAGTGPMETQLKEMVQQKGLEKHFVFTGFIKDIGRIYNIFDVNMSCSLSEALCLALIEGMTIGKPMIGTKVGGVPEVIQHLETGLLVQPGSSQELAEAILMLAEDEAVRKVMGDNALKVMKEKFSASVMAEEILKLYNEAADRRRTNEKQ